MFAKARCKRGELIGSAAGDQSVAGGGRGVVGEATLPFEEDWRSSFQRVRTGTCCAVISRSGAPRDRRYRRVCRVGGAPHVAVNVAPCVALDSGVARCVILEHCHVAKEQICDRDLPSSCYSTDEALVLSLVRVASIGLSRS